MNMHKVAILQARMTSSRLPGKVMLDIAGQPMLWHVIQRASQAQLVDQVVVATTREPSDDVLAQYCQKLGLPCFRGSQADVLDRFYQAATQFHADVVIRLTADCPLLDPDLIDLTVSTFLGQSLPYGSSGTTLSTPHDSPATDPIDFCANRLPPPWQRTLPIGLDVEVCTFAALERAWREAHELHQREHVMPYLYEGLALESTSHPVDGEWYSLQNTTPRGFRVAVLNHVPDYGSLRWTVDTQEDLEFVRQVYAHIDVQDGFGWKQVLALLEKLPQLASINSSVKHKSAFDVDDRGIES